MEKSRRHSLSDLSAGLLESSLSKYTDGRPDDSILGSIEEPQRPASIPKTAIWLGGLGEGAWFNILKIDSYSFEGTKFNEEGGMEYQGIYANPDIELPSQITVTYASHYGFYSIEIEGVVHRFYRKT
jgi:hypothetical protein